MTETEYEQLLQANERELWTVTQNYAKLSNIVKDELWQRAAMTMTPDSRADVAERLHDAGCEVSA
jgi:hypothetical protein